jgi:hypothetical protein
MGPPEKVITYGNQAGSKKNEGKSKAERKVKFITFFWADRFLI